MTYSFFLFLSLNLSTLLFSTAQAQSSFELMCRNQAKEIASETYKNCVTEHRQSQVEEIRKEYQEKLSELKSHYDVELKKISAGQIRNIKQAPQAMAAVKSTTASEIKKTGIIKRASGARELPEKSEAPALLQPQTQSQSGAPSNSQSNSSEIIELPVE